MPHNKKLHKTATDLILYHKDLPLILALFIGCITVYDHPLLVQIKLILVCSDNQ